VQVAEEISSLRGKKRLSIAPIYGGQSYSEQFRKLEKGIDIVVGTPGRIIDHIHRGSLKLDELTYVVLDEADEMLNMGFIDEVEEILKHVKGDRHMLLFSATMPTAILSLAKRYMKNYEHIAVAAEQLTTELTDQIYFEVRESDKFEALTRIVDMEPEFYGLIFCRTKVDVDRVTNHLTDRGYDAEGLHGDLSQSQRERIMDKFRNQRVNILVATDVAARGIDVQNMTHVINYALPQDPESYVHRIGRTGRAGKQGTAITFVTPSEYRKLLFIQKVAKTNIRKEAIPSVNQVIEQKRSRILDELAEVIENGDHKSFLQMAGDLLSRYEAQDAIAAVMLLAFEAELDEEAYQEISEVSINKRGTTRLFVALGRNKGMTPKKVADYIVKETGVENRKIGDIQIFEEFSFINVPFEEAEVILNTFRKKSKGHRSIVEEAKDRKKKR